MNTDLVLTERWLWLTLSFGLALLSSGIQLGGETLGKGPRPSNLRPFKTVVYQPLRLIYAVGLPAAALFWRGAFTERGLGLKPFPGPHTHNLTLDPISWENWAGDIGWAFTLGILAWLVLYNTQRTPPAPATITHRPGIALRDALFHQVHWAFYRETFVLTWGLGWGVWLGLLPAALEALINPACWNDWQSTAHARNLSIRIGLAIIGAMLYLQTQNLWLAILVDTSLGWALGQAEEFN